MKFGDILWKVGQRTWDWVTPWDTKHEQEQELEPYKTDVSNLQDEISDVKPYTPVDINDDGRWDQITDEEGNVVKDYSGLWEQLDQAKNTEIPDLDIWMSQQNDGQGYEFYNPMDSQTMTDMQNLIDQLTQGPSQMELGQAEDYAARTLGVDPTQYDNYINNLRTQSEASIGDMQGMSEEERAVRERAMRNDMRGMEERANRMIDNIRASSGSAARSYAAADQAISQINDAQIQQELAIYEDDFQRKKAESDKAMQRYQYAVQTGAMSKAQYLDLLQQSKAQAFQGYATKINTMLEQNQQYLSMYQSDLAGIEANINNIYKAINAEMGIDSKVMDDIEQQYQMEMAPLLTQLDIALQQLEQAESEQSTFNLGQFLTGAAMIVGGILLEPVSGGLSTGLVAGGTGVVGSSF